MEAVIFILFSTIEVLAYFYISFVMFRYKIQHYFMQVLLFSFVYAGISYFIRHDTELSPILGPFLSMILLFVLIFVLLRERIIFTMVMAISGYIVFMIVQTLLTFMVVLVAGVSFGELGGTSTLSRAMQLLTAVMLLGLGQFLYKKGIGFTFTLKKLNSKWEYLLVMIIISLFWIQLAAVLFYRNLIIAMIISLVGFAGFLYYGIKKETDLLIRKE